MRLVLFTAVLALGCDRGHPRERTPAPQATSPGASAPAAAAVTAPAASAPDPSCTLAAIPARYPAARRLVAIGDLHGDLAATRAAFRAAGAIDAADRWSGGELVIVQVGDILDRGDDEQAILDLLFRLEIEAKAAGGALIMLLGNHELMNAAGDFRYVTRGGMGDFDDVARPETATIPGMDPERWTQVPAAARGRIAALAPGGVYARKLAAHNVIAIVGDTVFSHAGVLGDWTTQLEEANRSARCWLDGQAGGLEAAPATFTSEVGPVWTRAVGGDPADCAQLQHALDSLGVQRMVVGHTVQPNGVSSACDGKVWRVDVGLAAHYGGPIEVLELTPDAAPRVLRGTR